EAPPCSTNLCGTRRCRSPWITTPTWTTLFRTPLCGSSKKALKVSQRLASNSRPFRPPTWPKVGDRFAHVRPPRVLGVQDGPYPRPTRKRPRAIRGLLGESFRGLNQAAPVRANLPRSDFLKREFFPLSRISRAILE